MKRNCIIGLDQPELSAISSRIDAPVQGHESLPKILVKDGQLFVESVTGSTYVPTSKVVFHGIFEDDHDLIAGLALWGGPCLPDATAMMDCRLKLPCLVRALKYSRFGDPARGYASPGTSYPTEVERIAKWGNWHCGENKLRFSSRWQAAESSIVERYLHGTAVRIVVIGDRHWQIQLAGDDWLKSIHHSDARFTDVDQDLLDDTREVARGFGLQILANDYIVTDDGIPHLLEVNHIPNVTRFPEIWAAYSEYVVKWLNEAQ
jgi:hypothetical protein